MRNQDTRQPSPWAVTSFAFQLETKGELKGESRYEQLENSENNRQVLFHGTDEGLEFKRMEKVNGTITPENLLAISFKNFDIHESSPRLVVVVTERFYYETWNYRSERRRLIENEQLRTKKYLLFCLQNAPIAW